MIINLLRLVAPAALAAASASVSLSPKGTLTVDGDSTLHRWSETCAAVQIDVQPPAGGDLAATARSGSLSGLTVRVPLSELKSHESGMDKNMRAAMKAGKFPEVVFKVSHYTLGPAADGKTPVAADGDLTISGTTKPAAIKGTLRFSADGMRLSGSYPLKMSDFGVTPPTLMFGTIKVRDEVTVRFDLVLPSALTQTSSLH